MKKAAFAAVCVLTFLLLVMMYALPMTAAVALAALLPLLMYFKARLGIFLPLALWLFWSIAAFFTNYDLTVILVSSLTLAAFIGLTLARGKNALRGFAVSAAACVLGLALPVMGLSIGLSRTPDKLVGDYVRAGENNIVVEAAAKIWYRGAEIDGKLSPSDEGYLKDALAEYAAAAEREAADYLLYYLMGYAVLLGGVGYLGTIFAARLFRLKIPLPDEPFSELRLPRKYLLYVALPVLAFSFLGGIKTLRPMTATVFNAFLTVPCAFAGFTLLLAVCKLFHGRARTGLYIGTGLIAAVCAFTSIGTFILSLLGFADVILNVRKMIDYALSDD